MRLTEEQKWLGDESSNSTIFGGNIMDNMLKMRMIGIGMTLVNMKCGYRMEDCCTWTVWHDDDDGEDVYYEALCC